MKLWRDEIPRNYKPIGFEDNRKDEIIRHNSFYLPEKGRSRDEYLHSPENRQIAYFKSKNT